MGCGRGRMHHQAHRKTRREDRGEGRQGIIQRNHAEPGWNKEQGDVCSSLKNSFSTDFYPQMGGTSLEGNIL